MKCMPIAGYVLLIFQLFASTTGWSRGTGQTHADAIEFSDLMRLMEQANEQALEKPDIPKVSVTVDFANAYVFRGSIFENFVIQPGIEVWGLGLPDQYGSISVGVWGNIDVNDNDGTSGGSEFSEIDWYGTYYLPSLIDGLYLFIGYIEYTYPAAEIPANKEVNAGIEYWIEKLTVGTTAYYGIGGDARGDNYYDLSASYYPIFSEKLIVSFDVLAGYYDPDTGPSGWNEGIVDVAAEYALGRVWSVGATVAYIVQLDDSLHTEFQLDESNDGYLFTMLSFSAIY